jgi:hypothetical protein
MGWTRSDIARRFGETRQFVSSVMGPQAPQPKRRERVIYVSEEAWGDAIRVAEENNLRLLSGENAGMGSVGALVEQIGRGNLIVRQERGIDDGPDTSDQGQPRD